MAMGTPAYMAPEVILGGGEVDRRVDVYAVGCVAYYLLTGERVFDAITDMRLMVKHLHEEPMPPSRRAEQPVPPEMDALVLACLRKNPDERPADAGELLRRLSGCDPGTWDQGSAQSWWERHMPSAAGLGPLALGLGENAIAVNPRVCRV
jgi:serine/threonine-protein kinase